MTREQGHVENWIGKNLWTIVALAVTATAGYIAGTTRTTMTLEQVQRDMSDDRAATKDVVTRVTHLERFQDCATRNFEMIHKIGPSQKPDCVLDNQ